MKKILVAAALLVGLSAAQIAPAADWADLKMTFVLKGTPPAPKPVVGKDRDPFCAALPLMSETVIVNSKNNGIQNVAIYVDLKRSDAKEIHPDLKAVEKKQFELANANCLFSPSILVVRPGQSVLVTNKDKTGHNANFNFLNNEPQNVTVPIGGSKELPIKTDEPAPIPVDCNIHPWMRAHVIVLDHPYVGISNADGELKIEKLPVGKVSFRVWHANTQSAIDEVTVGGRKEKWSRGRFELELKPGMNDFGKVEVDVSKFK